MYVHHAARAIYLAHPRTASYATVGALIQAGFVKSGPHHSQLHEPVSRFPGGPGWTIITTVRNHWDASVSWLCQHLTKPPTCPFSAMELEKGLPSKYVHWQQMWWMHLPDATVVWRFESLLDDFNKTLNDIGIEPPPLAVTNVSAGRKGIPYQALYTPDSKDYIGNRFCDEIHTLGYTFTQCPS